MDAARRVRDEWLALRCQSGEPGAFDSLISELERPLFTYLLQLTGNQEQATELLQETWIRALKSFRKLKDPSCVRSWLYALARGIAVDHIRRDHVRCRAEESYAGSAETSASPDPGSITPAELQAALQQLSPDHRDVLMLHFLEDFPIAEVASIVGCPEGTVKSRIHHAKDQLKKVLSRGHYGTR